MDKDEEILQLIENLSAAFPNVELKPKTIEIYLETFLDEDLIVLKKAFAAAIKTSKFFPTIAELNEVIRVVKESMPKSSPKLERREDDVGAAEGIEIIREVLRERFQIEIPEHVESVSNVVKAVFGDKEI